MPTTRSEDPLRWLDDVPRVRLAHLPTPLEPLHRLGATPGGPRLWLKRDDCTGLATGGNKTRKLEFLLADAQRSGASAVITSGAVQSNHARQTAAACSRLGLDCHLVLARRVPWTDPAYEIGGNVLLDRLFGAAVHVVEPAEVEGTAGRLREDLEAAGETVYMIPGGGSNPVGALGYVGCARELMAQCRAAGFEPDLVVHATASGGTQSGLAVGLSAHGADGRLLGINVYDRDGARLEQRIATLARALRDRFAPALPDAAVRIDHRFVGEGYGLPTRDTIEAIRMLATHEGILLDPVYSGKAFGGLLALIRSGELAGLDDVVFVHTGGTAVLGVYGQAFEAAPGA